MVTNEQIADELERAIGLPDNPAEAVYWAVLKHRAAILAALRGEPDAGEVERAAKALGRALEDAGIPNAARDDWTAEARAALTAAWSRPLTETVAACRALPWPGAGHD